MSTRVCLIVEVRAVKKKVKINKDEINLEQLKQKIITKFNITSDNQFNIIDDDECVIDDDDIEDFENKTKLYVQFLSTTNTTKNTLSWSCLTCTFINKPT
eukprot:110154_1